MHLVNGEQNSHISLLDRGVLYGHSVFETIATHQGQALLLEQHLDRLREGCERLRIPYDPAPIREDIEAILAASDGQPSVLRLSLTIGEGGRGYLSPDSSKATRIVSMFPMPDRHPRHWQEGIVLGKVDTVLADQPALAGIKHSNRLEQILARYEWQEGWQEAVVLDANKNVIEATQSNLFALVDDQLLTPDLSRQGVAGVMRGHIIKLVESELGFDCRIVRLSVSDLLNAQALFVTNSLIGLWPVRRFQDRQFRNFEFSTNLLNLLIKNESIPPF